jgi:hypothetical protein
MMTNPWQHMLHATPELARRLQRSGLWHEKLLRPRASVEQATSCSRSCAETNSISSESSTTKVVYVHFLKAVRDCAKLRSPLRDIVCANWMGVHLEG